MYASRRKPQFTLGGRGGFTMDELMTGLPILAKHAPQRCNMICETWSRRSPMERLQVQVRRGRWAVISPERSDGVDQKVFIPRLFASADEGPVCQSSEI